MTNEEIHTTANDIAYEHGGMRAVKLREDIATALRKAATQAYEEAARAVCPHCEKGLEHDRCNAAGIHELKESLQSETASA